MCAWVCVLVTRCLSSSPVYLRRTSCWRPFSHPPNFMYACFVIFTIYYIVGSRKMTIIYKIPISRHRFYRTPIPWPVSVCYVYSTFRQLATFNLKLFCNTLLAVSIAPTRIYVLSSFWVAVHSLVVGCSAWLGSKVCNHCYCQKVSFARSFQLPPPPELGNHKIYAERGPRKTVSVRKCYGFLQLEGHDTPSIWYSYIFMWGSTARDERAVLFQFVCERVCTLILSCHANRKTVRPFGKHNND